MRILDCSNRLRTSERHKKTTMRLFIVHTVCHSEGRFGIGGVRLKSKRTPQQPKQVPAEWKWTQKVYQEAGEIAEESRWGQDFVVSVDYSFILVPGFDRES
jgi:hypothetical protein